MKKTLKWLAVIAAIGTIIGIIIALLCKNKDDDDTFDFEDDDDFDLDSDLQPVDRGYVPLNKTTPEDAAPKAEDSSEPVTEEDTNLASETDTKAEE